MKCDHGCWAMNSDGDCVLEYLFSETAKNTEDDNPEKCTVMAEYEEKKAQGEL